MRTRRSYSIGRQDSISGGMQDLLGNLERRILIGMAFVIPVLIVGAVFLAAPQIAIGALMLAAGVGLSAAISKLVFAVVGFPESR